MTRFAEKYGRLARITLAGAICCVLFVVSYIQASAADAAQTKSTAEALVKRAGLRRGLCAVLGRDGDMAIQLAKASELLVHVRAPRSSDVAELRQQADEAGLSIGRLAVERGRIDRLPYADNMIDLIVATGVSADDFKKLSTDEILRALRPEGTAIIGRKLVGDDEQAQLAQLKKWATTAGSQNVNTWTAAGSVWVQLRKAPLEGIDDWSHWEKGPDNNPVSTDTVIKAPYMTQFLAKPYYIGMPAITTAAGGRTFLAVGNIAHHRREWSTLNRLIARNGYNGTILWERKLPDGYLVHRSAFVATKETFYMIGGDRCVLLDPQTGKVQGTIQIPGVKGPWKWMAIMDDVLYVLAGDKEPGTQLIKGDRTFGGWSWADLSKGYYAKPRIPYGFGHTLAAYDLKSKQRLWKHQEKDPIDSRAMAMRDDKIYLFCPEHRLRALTISAGRVAWTNEDKNVVDLIREPGKGLTSTPGWRTSCLTVATPQSLIIQGQTRMNVVSVSTENGKLLWTKRKITNNPNAIYVDGNIVLGIGPGGSHVSIDPKTGEVKENLKFRKRACTRLTASPDSLFCRGEGTLRYDRATKRLLVDGGIRPGCNDGAIPAHGLLYLGPWSCDCNLSLIGRMAKCSAGDFRFDRVATEKERLETALQTVEELVPVLAVDAKDWPTLRGNNDRSASSAVNVQVKGVKQRWQFTPASKHLATVPVAVGGLIFTGSEDGKLRAVDAASGKLRWQFATPAPIKAPPTVWQGRVLFGSGDGYVYSLDANTGGLQWRFRAAPVERYIMIYGALISTWPVNSGVLVNRGVAYFAAGIIDHDGTYVFALDAVTGKIKWQNNSSGHLNPELRKGVSAMGQLTISGDRLLLAGGNQVSPAPFDLKTGKCLAAPPTTGNPKANGGRFVGMFKDKFPIAGGRVLYSAPQNVSTKGSFVVQGKTRRYTLCYGGVPPAWDDNSMVLVNFKHGKLLCCEADKVEARLGGGVPPAPNAGDRRRLNLATAFTADGTLRWQSDLGQTNKFEAVSLAVCPNAVVSVVRYQQRFRAQTQWFLTAFGAKTGKSLFQQEIKGEPQPGGLLVDREGQIVVTLLDGSVVCYAGAR